MFFAILLIVLGALLLLNTMGIIVGNFWGFFWAIILLAIGLKMLVSKDHCPVCGGGAWYGKMRGRCCDHEHEE